MFKKLLKKSFDVLGYKVSKINTLPILKADCFEATKSSLNTDRPVVFDIGMNHGQTLSKIKKAFPNAIIHGFEASKNCFKTVQEKYAEASHIHINNLAMGDKVGVLQFNEYSWDAMNSFLTRAYGTARIVDQYDVQVTTIDSYCDQNSIDTIHILKSDTEGFELKVLQGAEKLLNANRIKFIHIELFFNLNFIGQSSVGEIFSFLESKNFSLINFSDFSRAENGHVSKADAFFINEEFSG